MSSMTDDFKKEIPHIIVLAVLVFILLFVVTKFKWVHCSQVPGDWCSVYCSVAGHSRVAIVSGDEGEGDPMELSRFITKNRVYTYAEPLPMAGISKGTLKNYELVIVERARQISPLQVNSILDYAATGGSVLWISDAGTQHFLTPKDLQDALYRNETDPGYYERLVKAYNQTKGFGDGLSALLKVNYQGMERGDNLTIQLISKDHLITKGLAPEFSINALSLANVNVNNAGTDILAYAYGTEKCTKENPCPAIVASRYAGPIAYFAFPMELAGSKFLVTNTMDYLVSC